MDGYHMVCTNWEHVHSSGMDVCGGGLLAYIKESHEYTLLDLLIYFKPVDQHTYYLVFAYRPPFGDYRITLDCISSTINKISSMNEWHTIIVRGDLNIDLLQKSRPEPKAFFPLFPETSLILYIDTPTRYGLSKNLISMFSHSSHVSYHGKINFNISDHLPIYLIIKKTKEHYTK